MRFKHLDRSNKGYLEKSDLLVLKEVSKERLFIYITTLVHYSEKFIAIN